jgi:ketosteroid isomerase-like protein
MTTTATSKTTDEVQLRELIAEQRAAMEAKDMDRLMKLYIDDVVVFDVKPPLQLQGVAAYRQMWEACLPYMEGPYRLEVRDLQLTVGGEMAFAHWFLRLTGLDVGHPLPWLRNTAVYRKVGGTWRIVHEHVSVPFHPENGQAALSLEP